ncbi:DNA-binding NtrC family response regulator [Pseudomonas oryzihabitans]
MTFSALALLQEKTVVLVEDNGFLLEVMIGHLECYGAICKAFGTADDASSYLDEVERPPFLVVTDHLLPGTLQGADFANQLAARWPDLSIIVASGYLDRSQLSPRKNTVFLPKPWLPGGLEKAILATF